MLNRQSMLILGIILLAVGLVLLNIPLPFEGAIAIVYIAYALIAIGAILIVLAIVFYVTHHA